MSLFDLQDKDIEEAVFLADVVKTRKSKFWKTSFGLISGLLGLLIAVGFGFGAQRIAVLVFEISKLDYFSYSKFSQAN